MEMLAPMTARLSALEQLQASEKPQVSTPDSLLEAPNVAQTARLQPKFPYPELFDGGRSKYAAF
jgi:hypothetical protein